MNDKNKLSLPSKLNVLLVEIEQHKTTPIEVSLDPERYHIVRVSHSGLSLLKAVESLEPDIIIIDIESPDRDMFESLNQISNSKPRPVIMFSEQDDTNTINELVRLGVSAYVVGEINKVRVKSIIDIAMARFSENQLLKNELKLTKEKLSTQKNVEKAKLWLMQTKDYNETQAYHCLRKMAMDNSQKMDEVAKNMLSVAAIFEGTK
ncbi:hypothetical protein A9Q98_02510 [Thalassotalea sp. 42_200_T64]|nr:hypothetical protein A9Q98_02510 [Thalassotalea sp. 42_200_T64]